MQRRNAVEELESERVEEQFRKRFGEWPAKEWSIQKPESSLESHIVCGDKTV